LNLPKKIMVIDDEVKILGIIRKMLQKEGYEVVVADSGKLCLEILENEKPDLILMDIMMPEMDGWETVRRIRKDRTNDGIIISMLSVKSLEEDLEKSLNEVHADWHLAKPIERHRLLYALDRLLKLK
jgi:CheY-like chemotaxis protein